MYAFAVVSVTGPPVAFENKPAGIKVPFVANLPIPGEKGKFEHSDGRTIPEPGVYLIMGKQETGTMNGRAWLRITGTCHSCSLGDGEKLLAALIKQLTVK